MTISLIHGQENGWVKQNLSNGIKGLKTSFTQSPSTKVLLAGCIGSVVTYQFEDSVQDWFLDQQPLPKTLNRFGDHYGELYSGLFALSLTGVHSLKQNEFQTLEYAFATLGANGVTSILLKETIRRDRPDKSNHRSFPSAHTSQSFATATILNETFGWKLGLPAYCLAIVTAMNRMQDNKHYLSDVVFGGSLGTALGIGFSKAYLGESKKINLTFNSVNSEFRFILMF